MLSGSKRFHKTSCASYPTWERFLLLWFTYTGTALKPWTKSQENCAKPLQRHRLVCHLLASHFYILHTHSFCKRMESYIAPPRYTIFIVFIVQHSVILAGVSPITSKKTLTTLSVPPANPSGADCTLHKLHSSISREDDKKCSVSLSLVHSL